MNHTARSAEPFTAAQIDSTLLLIRLERKNPRAYGKEDHSDQEVREVLLKVAAAYRQESKTAAVTLDAKDERVLSKPLLAAKFTKVFLRTGGEGREASFRLNPTFAGQLTKQIQGEQHRAAAREQSVDRRAARNLKGQGVLKSSSR